VAAVGCGFLAARPALVTVSPFGSAPFGVAPVGSAAAFALTLLFLALLVVGALFPLPQTSTPSNAHTAGWTTTRVVLVGVLAFAVGRMLVGGRPPVTATAFLIAANTLAAVAEEAWFRRLCFGLLAPAGYGFAIVGSAALFAVVHVPIYGLWVLPLDFAAGLLLGWQRSVTGSWTAPAITHVVANLAVVL
jgi:membrane protease YdiL (CAAX protease family)